MGIVLEGHTPDELPERLLGSVRFTRVDMNPKYAPMHALPHDHPDPWQDGSWKASCWLCCSCGLLGDVSSGQLCLYRSGLMVARHGARRAAAAGLASCNSGPAEPVMERLCVASRCVFSLLHTASLDLA